MVVRDRKNRWNLKSRRRKDKLRQRLVLILRAEPDGLTSPQIIDRVKTSGWKHTGSTNEITNVLKCCPGVTRSDTPMRMLATIGSRNYVVWKFTDESDWEDYISGANI